jgi:DNA-binding NarL/FixJ family response regulator
MGDPIAAADAAAHAALAFDLKNRRGSRLIASARASRLIAECGATTPATQLATCPLPLTAREHEIATLVGEGLSNKQIADALVVSVRSVEGHIYRACNKLGITSRTELGTLVIESTKGSI